MKTIYKYQLEIDNTQQIETYKFCQPLSVQMQNGIPCIWILVDLDEPKQKINVMMFGTGHSISDEFYVGPDHNLFMGTIQIRGLVFHVFTNGTFTI